MPIRSCFVLLFSAMLAFSLMACGGGGDTSAPVGEAPAASPQGGGGPQDQPPPDVPPKPKLPPLIRYFKASNTGADDRFGRAVALSADGKTLAVGACGEASNAIGVNGNQFDNSEWGAGAVYIFTRGAAVWSQQSYLKASNTEAGDRFGCTVALSADGSVLAVGAPGENSNATGINGNQSNNSAVDSGAVYVFTRNHGVWSQQAYVKASNTGAGDEFGTSVALSANGEKLAVGAPREDSSATGIGGNQADNAALSSGAVYLFERDFGTWAQKKYFKASNTDANDHFGAAVALSADGRTLAIGAFVESSNATGINGNQNDDSILSAGAAYVFYLNEQGGFSWWSQQAYLKASNNKEHSGFGYRFGQAIALSADGGTLAVGAEWDASNTTGINGNPQDDNSTSQAGAAYIFKRRSGGWTQQAYIKASNTDSMDRFGSAIALSGDGSTLAVGAYQEDSNATGFNGPQSNESAKDSGAVYVYSNNAGVWTQKAYVKASNTGTDDLFGWAIALSENGATLAVGAVGENSNATGINGNQNDNSASEAGAVYLVTNL